MLGSLSISHLLLMEDHQLQDNYDHQSLATQDNQRLLHNLPSRKDCLAGDVEHENCSMENYRVCKKIGHPVFLEYLKK